MSEVRWVIGFLITTSLGVMVSIKRQYVFRFLIGVIFLMAAVYYWPAYQRQIPKTRQESQYQASTEILQTPLQAPLTLVTEPDDGMAMVKNQIDGAFKTLDLVVYEFEDPELEQALVDAKNRGVLVRVILQNLDFAGQQVNQPAYDFLKSHGVAVMWAQDYFPLTHQKTLTIDGARSLIMTCNLDTQFYASSRDFIVVDSNPDDVAAISAAFLSDWSGAQETPGNGQDLVWSPASADTLLALINASQTSLDIYNEEMADPRIIEALKEAAKRGVAVRVAMTYNTSWKDAFNELTSAGVSVHTYASTSRHYIHAKVMVADFQRAFVGSQNFSLQSLDLNRELGILISRSDIVSSLETTFANDWLSSRPYVIK